MGGKRFRIGSVAVLFAVVVLCVAIFCILTSVTAVSDARMADQYGDHIQEVYDCQAMGEKWLAKADACFAGLGPVPENSDMSGNQMTTQIQYGAVCLDICIEKQDTGFRILQWDCTTQWQPDNGWTLLQ